MELQHFWIFIIHDLDYYIYFPEIMKIFVQYDIPKLSHFKKKSSEYMKTIHHKDITHNTTLYLVCYIMSI